MRTPAAARSIPEGRLRLSRSPTTELAAAALLAQEATELEACDFIIVALPPGAAGDKLALELERVSIEHVAARDAAAAAG